VALVIAPVNIAVS